MTEFSAIEVKVGRLPGRIETYGLNGNRKVSDALEAAGLTPDGYEVRVNTEVALLSQELEDGDQVLLVKAVKGN